MTEIEGGKEDGAPQCSWPASAVLDRHPLQQYVSLHPPIYSSPHIASHLSLRSSLPLAILPSNPLLLHLMVCLFVLQQSYKLTGNTLHFLWTSTVCITVAVHNKMPLPTHTHTLLSPPLSIVATTHVCCYWAFCWLAGTEWRESLEKRSVGEWVMLTTWR